MLDLLQHDLLLKGSDVEIGNMAFFQTSQEAYNHWETREYDENRHFACPWSIGQALEMGERGGLNTMVHINSDH
jgi:hypothetical protein